MEVVRSKNRLPCVGINFRNAKMILIALFFKERGSREAVCDYSLGRGSRMIDLACNINKKEQFCRSNFQFCHHNPHVCYLRGHIMNDE
jgi:hypothetical protein